MKIEVCGAILLGDFSQFCFFQFVYCFSVMISQPFALPKYIVVSATLKFPHFNPCPAEPGYVLPLQTVYRVDPDQLASSEAN